MTVHSAMCSMLRGLKLCIIWVGAFVSTGNTINSAAFALYSFFLCSLINVYWFLSVFLLNISYCQRLNSVHDTTTLVPHCLWNRMLVILTNCRSSITSSHYILCEIHLLLFSIPLVDQLLFKNFYDI